MATPSVRSMNTRLTPTAYLDHIRSESARFRAVLADTDPTAPVPSAPDWTDFNESDPGMTLLQLFAFLAFALLFTVAFKRWRRRRLSEG